MKKKRIGIMGGTFDPIHYGHLLIAENAADQYQLDEVIFMPTGYSPHKTRSSITEAIHRCNMVELAISDNSQFSLSTMEIEKEEVNYTYQTLEELKITHPEDELFFIMGGDSLKDFKDWKYPERILNAANILSAVRDDMEGTVFRTQMQELNSWYGKERIYQLNTPNFAVSSRSIRKLVCHQKTVRYMLPESVRDYIQEHKLYLDEDK